MSEGIIIALIGAVSAFICAGIAAFGGIVVASINGKGKGLSIGVLGLLGFIGAGIGLLLGSLFGAKLMQQLQPEIAQTTPRVNQLPEPITGSGSLPVQSPTQQVSECYGDWEGCWTYNDSAQTMTWIGLQNGAVDIGQDGTALNKIQSGYTAIFTIETNMKIHICVGTINNEALPGECPNVLTLSPGTYRIKSPGSSGGFRVYQQ